MACRLFGAKPLAEPVLVHCQYEPWYETSVKFEQNEKKKFHSENVFENVICKMVSNLFRGNELIKSVKPGDV